MTFVLVSVVYAVAVGEPSFGNVGPLAVGLSLFAMVFAGRPSSPTAAFPLQTTEICNSPLSAYLRDQNQSRLVRVRSLVFDWIVRIVVRTLCICANIVPQYGLVLKDEYRCIGLVRCAF